MLIFFYYCNYFMINPITFLNEVEGSGEGGKICRRVSELYE